MKEPTPTTTITMSRAKRLSEMSDGQVAPPSFDSDSEFFDTFESVAGDWPAVDIYFNVWTGQCAYIDTAFVCYNDIIEDWTDDNDHFREYMTVHFKNWMQVDADENEGICPFCDDRIEVGDIHSMGPDALARLNVGDDNLWAAPDEFDFREYEHFGKCVRMWWD